MKCSPEVGLRNPVPTSGEQFIRERQREGIALAKQRGAYTGRKKTLTPEKAAELVTRAGNGAPKAVLARDYGISRETVYQYLRRSKLGRTAPLPAPSLCRSRRTVA